MAHPEFTCAVSARPLPEQSDPELGVHAFAYTVTIRNSGDVTAQLVARHWIITDTNGVVQEVRGLAVVGHQPVLKPGESFEYSSWTQLLTPQGSMRGSYLCVTEEAETFEAKVPEFGLTQPSTLH